jgi:hypothetical protein
LHPSWTAPRNDRSDSKLSHWVSISRSLGNETALVRSTVVGFPDDSSPAYNCRMAARRINEPIEPMTLGNMRANGVRSLDVSCWQCHHRAILNADPWSDGLFYSNELRLLRVRRDSSSVS